MIAGTYQQYILLRKGGKSSETSAEPGREQEQDLRLELWLLRRPGIYPSNGEASKHIHYKCGPGKGLMHKASDAASNQESEHTPNGTATGYV